MSSGSLKELVKALSTAFAAPATPCPLPDEITQVIEAYLLKHEGIDDHDSQRLHDDLLIIYRKHVVDEPQRHAAFLAALKQLRPAIKGADRLLEWWTNLVRPIFESSGRDKVVASETRGIILSILIYDEEKDHLGEAARISRIFTEKLLELYLERTRSSIDTDESLVFEDEELAVVVDHLESVLLCFGRKRPQDLLVAINALIVQKENRSQALSLLSMFVRHQPPHLHQVLHTDLIDSLLKCLMIDTSTTVLSLALTNLVMFLSHIPNALGPMLPRLFVIYSRLLCWERFNPHQLEIEGEPEKQNSFNPNGGIRQDEAWEKLSSSDETADASTHDLTHFFTFLYGLYPVNFLSYIRDAHKYLREANFPGANEMDFDQEMTRQRTERFRRVHLLHPNLFTTTPEAELTDLNRWMNSDPADIVSECMALTVGVAPRLDDPGPPPTTRLPDLPSGFVSDDDIPAQNLLTLDDDGTTLANEDGSPTNSRYGEAWMMTDPAYRNSMQSRSNSRRKSQRKRSHPSMRANANRSSHPSPAPRAHDIGDSPTLPPVPVRPDSEVMLQDMLSAQETLRNSAHQPLAADNISLHTGNTPSPRLDAYLHSLTQTKMPRSPAMRPDSSDVGTIASLQREIVILKNDLNFERYLKTQQIAHIGQLQRKNLKDATVEADTQNIISTNRALRVKLEEAKRSYASLKRETSMSKNQAKKWESELNAKIRTLREEQKHWRADEGSVRRELEKARRECDQLRKLVVDTEAKELLSRQNLQSIEMDLNEVERYRAEIEKLTTRCRDLEGQEKDFELAKHNEELARTELEMANLKLRSRDGERDRLKKAYDQRIDELEEEIESLQSTKAGQAPKAFQSMLDSALAASHSRFNHLKKAHNDLYRRYRALDIRYMDLVASKELRGNSSGGGGGPSSALGSPSANDPSKYLIDDFDLLGDEHLLPLPTSTTGTSAALAVTPDARPFHTPAELSEAHDGFDEDFIATSPIGIGLGTSSYPSHSMGGNSSGPSRRASVIVRQNSAGAGISGGAGGVGGGTMPLGVSGGDPAFEAYRAQRQKSGLSASSSLRNSDGSGSGDNKVLNKYAPRVKADSQVRVYGRGGVQNIGKKEKDKKKSGGIIASGLAGGLVGGLTGATTSPTDPDKDLFRDVAPVSRPGSTMQKYRGFA